MSAVTSIAGLLKVSAEKKLPLWKTVQLTDCAEQDMSEADSWEKMKNMLSVMREADQSYDSRRRSLSGLSGGDGGKMEDYVRSGRSISGPLVGEIIAAALRMGECNACMKRIVAAPTAGACGVLPAVIIICGKAMGLPDEMLIEALYAAAGVGQVIALRASISGAQSGCQAEIGAASAMAAAALTHMAGGTSQQIANASALALKSLLGLVCDPVGGLVEVPCVKRNAAGAVIALTAAEMSLAGIESRVPPDEVIDAMREVGEKMSPTLRETAEGGLADTETASKFRERDEAAIRHGPGLT